jgi:hypothetical protein
MHGQNLIKWVTFSRQKRYLNSGGSFGWSSWQAGRAAHAGAAG